MSALDLVAGAVIAAVVLPCVVAVVASAADAGPWVHSTTPPMRSGEDRKRYAPPGRLTDGSTEVISSLSVLHSWCRYSSANAQDQGKLMNANIVKPLLAVALVAGLVAVAIGSGSDPGSGSGAPAGADAGDGAQAAPRTVLVSSDRMPSVSRPGGPLHVLRRSGPVPDRAESAMVLSDADCAPNARGVSNCLNRLRLADGRTLTVRHPHRMMDVPCLSAGERVTVATV